MVPIDLKIFDLLQYMVFTAMLHIFNVSPNDTVGWLERCQCGVTVKRTCVYDKAHSFCYSKVTH